MIRRLWLLKNYHELIVNFVLRDVKEKYRRTILGYLWTLVTPLLLMGIFFLIFTYIFPVNVQRYPLYVMVGLLSWNFFSSSLYDAVHSISGGSDLLKKVYFPAEIYPISATITNLITFCFSLLVLVPFLLSYRVPVGLRLLWLPGIILWQGVLCLGLGMILAIVHVFFRDTGPMVGAVLNLWFYATPIFYSTAIMPPKVMAIYFLNPAAVIVELYRWAIMGNPPPMHAHLIYCGILTVGLFLTGSMLYERWGRHVTKVL